MRRFVNLACIFGALWTSGASGAVVSFTSSADVFMTTGPTNNLGNNNYGAGGALMVAGTGGGKGEFKTLVRFDTASVKSDFDALLGTGQWHITSITLRNAGNIGSPGGNPGNAIFPTIQPGDFNISWIASDTWLEGTGSPGTPTTDGVTYNSLNSFLSASDRALGTFTWDAPGDNVQRTWSLALDSSLVVDVIAGTGQASFLYTPVSNNLGFLFNSRSFGTAANRPALSITAEVPEPAGVAAAAVAGVLLRRRRS